MRHLQWHFPPPSCLIWSSSRSFQHGSVKVHRDSSFFPMWPRHYVPWNVPDRQEVTLRNSLHFSQTLLLSFSKQICSWGNVTVEYYLYIFPKSRMSKLIKSRNFVANSFFFRFPSVAALGAFIGTVSQRKESFDWSRTKGLPRQCTKNLLEDFLTVAKRITFFAAEHGCVSTHLHW